MFRNPSGLYYNNFFSPFYPLGVSTVVISVGKLIASPRCQGGGKIDHCKTSKASSKMDRGSEVNTNNKPKQSSSLASKIKKVSYQGS